MPVEYVNEVVGVLVILSLLSFLLLFNQSVRAFVARHGLSIGFLISAGGVLVSLYYSNVVGYAPCVLCWYQRIFFIPQVFILGIAAYKKDFSIRIYSLTLAAIGGLIALYDVLLGYGLAPEGVCGTTGPSCTARYVYEFGFVTIPFMSLVGFVLIVTLVWMTKYRRSSQ